LQEYSVRALKPSHSPSPHPLIGPSGYIHVQLTISPAYAVYFDHKRRNDPEFRKSLKREARRAARLARTQAEAQGAQHRQAIKAALAEAAAEGYPTNVEEKEAFFMNEVARGETLCQDGGPSPAGLNGYEGGTDQRLANEG
jgi:hypothetical protein